MADWGTIISGVDAALGVLSKIKSGIEVREQLMDSKEALLKVKQENLDLTQQVQQLEETLRRRDQPKLPPAHVPDWDPFPP